MNDYAHVLSDAQRTQLEQQLQSYEVGTRQMAVAIFKSLDGESVDDFSNRLAIKWAIGSKTNKDGVVVTVFVDDHKARIEVGYGLEDKLTDALSSRIMREIMIPRFRKNDYYGGLSAGLDEINHIVNGGQTRLPKNAPRGRDTDGMVPGLLLFAVILVIALAVRRRGGGGGGFTGGSGGWIFTSGGWGGSGWSSGGGWGGGGGGSSGSDGGFSGGGGDFGGGGASGSW